MASNSIDISPPVGTTTSEMNISFGEEPKENSTDFLASERKSYCFIAMSASIASGDKSSLINMKESENFNNFSLNNKLWNTEKQFDSFNNFDSGYFDEIVKMGEDAVPYILEELKRGPSQIVHALDLIFPGKVQYEGFVPLKTVCETWISILSKTENA